MALGAVRHGLLPLGLATARTLKSEGTSELHWKVLGDALVRFLRHSGPVFTKFGQILATRPDLLPAPLCARLEALYARQVPMGRRQLRRSLREAHGEDSPFAEFCDAPLAVGSVGQVHRARLADGTRVIVKVLRPGVEQQIERDLEVARALLPLVLGAERGPDAGARRLLRRCLDDLGEAYAAEVDLRREAAALEEFARRFRSDRRVKVPECFRALSSQRVLVMEELVGEPLSAFRARAEQDPAAARRAAHLALTEILRQIFEDGRFHADPHAGNLLILEDGRLGVIDLGLTGELGPDDRRRISRAVRAFLARDAEALVGALLGFGRTPEGFDAVRFRADVAAVVRRRGAGIAAHLTGRRRDPAGESPLDDFVGELFGVAHAHGIRVPRSSTLLIKTLVTIEGVGRSLHPELDLAAVAAPVILRSLAPRWMRWALGGRGRSRSRPRRPSAKRGAQGAA
jgi:ubiquinone biosynthesis protein